MPSCWSSTTAPSRIKSLLGVGLAVLLLTPGLPRAQGHDPASEEALKETLRLLLDPSLRNPELAKNPQAAEIDKQIRSMTGSEKLTQEFYDLAARIFEELTRNSGGDPARMSEALERGQSPARTRRVVGIRQFPRRTPPRH